MKRRRFITLGSILAMMLSLATVGYVAWLGGLTINTVEFPAWLPIPVLVAYPIIYFGWRFRRRCRLGHCLHCDYDLTVNESGECPECGTEIKDAAVGCGGYGKRIVKWTVRVVVVVVLLWTIVFVAVKPFGHKRRHNKQPGISASKKGA